MNSSVAYLRRLPSLLLLCAILLAIAISAEQDSELGTENQNVFRPSYANDRDEANHPPIDATTTIEGAIHDVREALAVLQTEYFSLWQGTWTEAIDWTAAVMGTHVSATLSSLSRSLVYTMSGTFGKMRKLDVEAQMVDNEIDKYFGQITAYYFGEDFFGIRLQAFDDMLWVVLGWLESIQFITSHSKAHYPPVVNKPKESDWWHGRQFIPPFAHRARVFYELAEKGWDWKLCGGGMTWNKNLLPYKNAITNQLFIAASVGMYLRFPGDDNSSPFSGVEHNHPNRTRIASGATHNPTYLTAAINGYNWLANSNMTNAQGLYVDGFHIAGYSTNHSKTACDERNEMVYTYNQGVILSGLRGLWEATGNLSYLADGHELCRNVIRATGWSDTDITIAGTGAFPRQQTSELNAARPKLLDSWAGLGSYGILTELCDPSGSCSQDSQTFKGIFFHHLVAFCTPLPHVPVKPGKTHAANSTAAALHHRSCSEYKPWVVHNAKAALKTRDGGGRFGMWWGDRAASSTLKRKELPTENLLPESALDYRAELSETDIQIMTHRSVHRDGDLNDRGRGRTVETQGGGVAVVKAMWEFKRRYDVVKDGKL